MTEDNLLSHQVHQFRYVISAYQAPVDQRRISC